MDRSECLALGQQSSSGVATFINCLDAKGYVMVDYEEASNVGKNNWLFGDVHFCQSPANLTTCSTLGPPAIADSHYLKVEGIERGRGIAGTVLHYYRVTLDDGRTGYIATSDLLANATDVDPVNADSDCKRRGNPRVGMTAKQVEETCWGKPEHVNRTLTTVGISDQYVYRDGRFIYLQNGIVTSIQATGTLRQ